MGETLGQLGGLALVVVGTVALLPLHPDAIRRRRARKRRSRAVR